MNQAVLPDDPKALAVAVIAQAFFDLRDVINGAGVLKSSHQCHASERYEAVHFLTDTTGGWSEARTLWAELADLNPDVIRDTAVAEINAPPQAKRKPRGPQRQVHRTPHPDTRTQESRT